MDIYLYTQEAVLTTSKYYFRWRNRIQFHADCLQKKQAYKNANFSLFFLLYTYGVPKWKRVISPYSVFSFSQLSVKLHSCTVSEKLFVWIICIWSSLCKKKYFKNQIFKSICITLVKYPVFIIKIDVCQSWVTKSHSHLTRQSPNAK